MAASAAIGLAFAARAQQQHTPGETPPIILDPDEMPQDDLNADDLAAAVGEGEAERDGGPRPAQVIEVPAAATNAVVQHVDHP